MNIDQEESLYAITLYKGDNSLSGVLRKALHKVHGVKDNIKCSCKMCFKSQCNKLHK